MRSRDSQRGMSLLEFAISMGIVGALGLGALGTTRIPGPDLTIAAQELTCSLDEAFVLARASGQPVLVSGSSTKGIGHLPVSLPRSIHWGLPPDIPLPPHMDPTVKAASTGEAHTAIVITPRHTATATVWFLNDGRDALCLRVNDQGQRTLLRWRASRHRWGRA